MKGKRILAMLMAIAMMTSILAACGSSDDDDSSTADTAAESTTDADTGDTDTDTGDTDTGVTSDVSGSFTYWSAFTGDSATWDEGRVATFMELYPDIEINYQAVPDAAGISNGKLLSALAAGNGPDLIIADAPQSAYAFACNGSFVAWDNYMDAMGVSFDDFSEGYHELMTVDGETLLIPQDSNAILLFVRKDHMEEAGLSIDDAPKTLDELDEWAEILTVGSDGDYDRYGFILWLDSGADAFTFPFIAGGTLFDTETSQFVLTDDNTVEFYSWLQSYAQKYNPEKMAVPV